MKKVLRCLMHMPVGALNVWLFMVGVHFGWAFLIFFALYELNEDRYLKDQAWIDIAGWLWGFSLFILVGNLIGGII